MITGIALATGLVHVLGIGHRTSGVVSRWYSSYFSDVALPFAAYFLLCASEKSFPALRPWWTKLVLVFGAATTAEILQFFGVYALGKTFDPLDVVAYATGALSAVAVERAVFAKYQPRSHRQPGDGLSRDPAPDPDPRSRLAIRALNSERWCRRMKMFPTPA